MIAYEAAQDRPTFVLLLTCIYPLYTNNNKNITEGNIDRHCKTTGEMKVNKSYRFEILEQAFFQLKVISEVM